MKKEKRYCDICFAPIEEEPLDFYAETELDEYGARLNQMLLPVDGKKFSAPLLCFDICNECGFKVGKYITKLRDRNIKRLTKR